MYIFFFFSKKKYQRYCQLNAYYLCAGLQNDSRSKKLKKSDKCISQSSMNYFLIAIFFSSSHNYSSSNFHFLFDRTRTVTRCRTPTVSAPPPWCLPLPSPSQCPTPSPTPPISLPPTLSLRRPPYIEHPRKGHTRPSRPTRPSRRGATRSNINRCVRQVKVVPTRHNFFLFLFHLFYGFW